MISTPERPRCPCPFHDGYVDEHELRTPTYAPSIEWLTRAIRTFHESIGARLPGPEGFEDSEARLASHILRNWLFIEDLSVGIQPSVKLTLKEKLRRFFALGPGDRE